MLNHISITDCLKAHPVTEGDERFVYIEASNESRDAQGEQVLAKALQESSDYYLKYGNIDLDHLTQIGGKAGIPDYHFYEIGRPVEVNINRSSTWVKGHIFKGDGPSAARANDFWLSLTAQDPPQRWFPSIGGQVKARAPTDKSRVVGVRWTNIGFSKTPVNQEVAEVSAMPIGAFAKAMTAEGLLDLGKALEAGYGTDAAALTGGAALREQSLEGAPLNYWDFRERAAKALREGSATDSQSLQLWAMQHARLGRSLAAEWVSRFMADLSHSIKRKSR